ncbi:MAG: hypothetical protein JO022_08845 [Acidobacteriaceae bacterium]|nr:hypothetical protein [Acidobacteriaceae bacterium]
MFRCTCALFYCLLSATAGTAATITITQVLDSNAFTAPGYTISSIQVTGINNSGAIAGTAVSDVAVTSYGLVRQPDASLSYFQPIPGAATTATSINNQGQIAGGVAGGPVPGTEPEQRYVRNADGSTLLFAGPSPDNTLLVPVALNDNGVVAFTPFPPIISFLGPPQGPFETLKLPPSGIISAINDQGTIIGQFSDGVNIHGFIRNADGSFTTIGFSNYVVPTAIDSFGDVVGYYLLNYPGGTPDNYPAAGFYRFANGDLVTFSAPARYTDFVGVNDLGQILGDYSDAGSYVNVGEHVFIAQVNPVLEPSTGFLCLLGICIFCCLRSTRAR